MQKHKHVYVRYTLKVQLEGLLPTLVHVQVIKHLNERDSNFINILCYHRLLQTVGRELKKIKNRISKWS